MLENDGCQRAPDGKGIRTECDARVGLARSIGADDGGEVGIAEEEGVVSFVGLEVLESVSVGHRAG